MHPRIVILAGLMMAVFSVLLAAETVTVTVVQNKNAPEIAISMSRIVEDALLGVYFDSGQIVTTTDIAYDGNRYHEKNYGVKVAAHGLADFVLVVYLDYGASEKIHKESNLKYAELSQASWKLVRVRNSDKVAEQTLDLSAVPVRDFDPEMQIRKLGELIARNSLEKMREVRKGENQ